MHSGIVSFYIRVLSSYGDHLELHLLKLSVPPRRSSDLPFVSIDGEGAGELIELAAERGRATRRGIKLGICGEHGGDPASIAFCEKTGLDYVSASPYRVPIRRLAPAPGASANRK